MVTFLSRLLIKNYKEYEDPEVRKAYGFLTGLVGIVLNFLLFLGKYSVGLLCGSVSIRADAFNNLSDAASNVITLLGFHFAGKKPDTEHPFGHGRIEYVSGLGVAVMIIVMGVELFHSSILKIFHPGKMQVSGVTMLLLVLSILVKVYMAIYNRIIGNKIHSQAMRATAMDSLSDTIATSLVLVSMILYYFTHVNLDGWAGVLVAIFILCAGAGAVKDTLSPLLGEAPDMDFVKEVEQMVKAHKIVVGVHDMVVHNYGPGRVMVSLHAEVPGNENVYHIHDEIDLIERELKEKFHCEAVIHMDPIAVDDALVMGMRKKVEELVKELDPQLSIHDFRMVQGDTHTNLIFDVVVPQEYPNADEEVQKEITDLIEQRWENYHAVIKMEKKYT